MSEREAKGGTESDEVPRSKKQHTNVHTNTTKHDHPIHSYGLILFSLCTPDQPITGSDPEPRYLIYQRRDNYEYMDILRGIWNTEERFKELVSALSTDERERLLSYTFKELWDDLWIVHGSKIHTEGYERARKKYEQIRPRLHEILADTTGGEMEPPWGFPKGKKISDGKREEEDTVCALREFQEETRMEIKDIKLWPTLPFVEVYKGNNDKMYSTNYYLAEIPCALDIKKIETPECIRQTALSEESADALWVSIEEACLKLNPRRQIILKKIDRLIRDRYDELTPLEKSK